MYNLKPRQEEELVESLIDNESKNLGAKAPLPLKVKDVQLGPKKMINYQKNLEDSKVERFRPDSA